LRADEPEILEPSLFRQAPNKPAATIVHQKADHPKATLASPQESRLIIIPIDEPKPSLIQAENCLKSFDDGYIYKS
jgi:hypothetical protein